MARLFFRFPMTICNEWLMFLVLIRETITIVDKVSSFKLSKKNSKLLLKMLLFRQFLVEFIF
jgi:hypothetical protein